MAEIQRTIIIKKEIKAIDDAVVSSKNAKTKLRAFVLDKEAFLKEYLKFDLLLSEWADTLMTLVGVVGVPNTSPTVLSSQEKLEDELISPVESEEFTLTKGLVIAVAIFGSVFTCVFLQVKADQALVFVGLTTAGSLALAFFRSISDAVRGWLKKPEKPKSMLNSMTNSIAEKISWMRDEYKQSRFLIKFQVTDPLYGSVEDPSEDAALFDREVQIKEDLPSTFISVIDGISVEMNTIAFDCKNRLLAYLNSVPQPTAPLVNQGV